MKTLPEKMALERIEKWNGYWTMNMGDSPGDEQAMFLVRCALKGNMPRLLKACRSLLDTQDDNGFFKAGNREWNGARQDAFSAIAEAEGYDYKTEEWQAIGPDDEGDK